MIVKHFISWLTLTFYFYCSVSCRGSYWGFYWEMAHLLTLHIKLWFSLANIIFKQTAFLVAAESLLRLWFLNFSLCLWRPPCFESATLSSHAQLVQSLALQTSRGLVSQQARLKVWLAALVVTGRWVGYISCPSTIKLPCAAVFESDTVEAGQGSVP